MSLFIKKPLGRLPDFILPSGSNQNSVLLAQKQKHRSLGQDRKPRNKLVC